jgi:tetratricopeptide (TPR) repeat protein
MPLVAAAYKAVTRVVLPVLVIGGAAACSPALGTRSTAAAIPQLERRLERSGADPRALLPLAVAYHDAGRSEDALRMLERTLAAHPANSGARFYLGVVNEELGRTAEARRWYSQYLEVGRSRRLVAEVHGRILALDREALLAQVREAIAREAEIGQETRAMSVAVYPFLYVGSDPSLQPLERAFAELLTTDLALSRQLTVLERSRVQLLLDEIRLGESGRVDPATAPHAGRLLRAGTIVQGRLDGTAAELAVQVAVVGVTRPDSASPLVERDAVRRLFELQKRLAMGVFHSLGVELSGEERARFAPHATNSLQALLLFGRGLEALDGGRFPEAMRLFQQAAAQDPAFGAARDYAARASSLALAASTSLRQLGQAGLSEVPQLADPILSLDAVHALLPPSVERSPAPEAFGTQGIARPTLIDIIIRRP